MVNYLRYGVPLPAYTYAPGSYVTPDNLGALDCG
jgi:hypothetical protein